MGAEDDYLAKIQTTKPMRKSSLHTRLQEGESDLVLRKLGFSGDGK